MDGRWVSPNDMFLNAQRMMLDGKEPESREDWVLIVNFFAANVAAEMAFNGVKLMCLLFNCPLEEELVRQIVQFQLEHKEAKDETVDSPAVVQGKVPAPGKAHTRPSARRSGRVHKSP